MEKVVHPAHPPLHLSGIWDFLCPSLSWNPDGVLSGALELPGSCVKGFMKTHLIPFICFFMRCFVAFTTLGHRMGIGESLSCGFQVLIKRLQVSKLNSSCLEVFCYFFGFGNKSKLKNIFQVL